MTRITDYTRLIAYVHHLGFAGIGPIAYRQQNLCAVADAIEAAALTFYPFRVTFHTYREPYTRLAYHRLGRFTITDTHGATRTVCPPR